METFYFCTAMTIRFCYGSSELKNYIEKFQNFLENFFENFLKNCFRGNLKK